MTMVVTSQVPVCRSVALPRIMVVDPNTLYVSILMAVMIVVAVLVAVVGPWAIFIRGLEV